jgi:hypothetical protein
MLPSMPYMLVCCSSFNHDEGREIYLIVIVHKKARRALLAHGMRRDTESKHLVCRLRILLGPPRK